MKKSEENEYLIKKIVLSKFYNGRDLLEVLAEMQKEIICKTHDKRHFDAVKTEIFLKKHFYIPNMGEQVESAELNFIEQETRQSKMFPNVHTKGECTIKHLPH